MKLAEAAVLGLLAAGCPMLLFASTLKADLSYRIDTISQPGKLLLVETARRSDARIFLLLLGLAQGGTAIVLGRQLWQREATHKATRQSAEATASPLAALPASTQAPIEIPGEPIARDIPNRPTPSLEVAAALDNLGASPVSSAGQEPHPATPVDRLPAPPATDPLANPTPTAPSLKQLGLIGAMVSGELRHHAVSASSRCGKTLTTRAFVYSLWLRYGAKGIVFSVIDPKKDAARWMGLERIPGCLAYPVETVEPAIAKIDQAYQLLIHRIHNGVTATTPVFCLVIDEWYSILKMAKPAGVEADLLLKMQQIATKGLASKIKLFLITHSHLCQNFGFDSHERYNFVISGIGRKASGYQMVHHCASDTYLIPDGHARKRMKLQMQKAIAYSETTGLPAIATTYRGGHVLNLPNLLWLNQIQIPEAQPISAAFEGIRSPISATRMPVQWDADTGSAAAQARSLPSFPTLETNGAHPGNGAETIVPVETIPETDADFVSAASAAQDRPCSLRLDAETVSKYFPDTPESALFQRIQDGYENRLSPSDIVKKQLKLTSTERYPIGRALCIDLVRKYGSTELMLHFKKWLDA